MMWKVVLRWLEADLYSGGKKLEKDTLFHLKLFSKVAEINHIEMQILPSFVDLRLFLHPCDYCQELHIVCPVCLKCYPWMLMMFEWWMIALSYFRSTVLVTRHFFGTNDFNHVTRTLEFDLHLKKTKPNLFNIFRTI